MDKLIFVGGSKGGTGKSTVCGATLDYLIQQKKKPLLIESDGTNPDVWKAYKDSCDNIVLNLDEAEGWIELINVADKTKGCPVVVNTAARNSAGVERYGETLRSTLKELNRELTTLWVINRQRDSLELLADYLDALPEGQVHVIRNTYWGESQKFEMYNGSAVKKRIDAGGGKSLDFPDLADRVSDALMGKRLTIEAAVKELPIGDRAELLRWRAAVGKVLEEVLG